MLILVKFDYNYYVLPLEALPNIECIQQVEEKYVAGNYKYYLKEKETNVEVKIIQDNQLVNPKDKEAVEKDTKLLLEEEKRQSAQYSEWWSNEQKKTKDLEAQLKAMKELCPDSHKKEEVKVENVF
jgi:NhaP-type Na+/H+ and K+/H+ antiporter